MALLLEPGFVPPDIPTVEKIIDLKPDYFDEPISTFEAAVMLGTTQAALDQMRYVNEGPPYSRHGRLIRYTRRDIIDYIRDLTVKPPRPQRKHVRMKARRSPIEGGAT